MNMKELILKLKDLYYKRMTIPSITKSCQIDKMIDEEVCSLITELERNLSEPIFTPTEIFVYSRAVKTKNNCNELILNKIKSYYTDKGKWGNVDIIFNTWLFSVNEIVLKLTK